MKYQIRYVVQESKDGVLWRDVADCMSEEEAIEEIEDRTLTPCEECGERWSEQELNSYAWHCLKCGHKIGD